MTLGLDTGDPCPAREGFVMPAEWAPHARTWMCWPCRDEAWGSTEAMLRARHATARVARAISAFEPVTLAVRREDHAEAKLATGCKVELLETPLDDSWARDIGPTFLRGPAGGRGAVQWRFNAWGGKYRPYNEDAALAARIATAADVRLYTAPLVCEGGAIHTDGEGTLLATEQCLLNSNRNPQLTQQQVEEQLALYTGARRIVWLGMGFSDSETDGHVDNIACFVAPGRVLVGVPCSRSHPDFKPVIEAIRRLREARDAEGRTFEVIEIEQPRIVRFGRHGHPLPSSYVNFYLPNGSIIMPAFDDSNDEKARSVLADCFPGRDILQIDALDIIQGGGGIHCITQQEPAAP
jgi:agmatine deiminase